MSDPEAVPPPDTDTQDLSAKVRAMRASVAKEAKQREAALAPPAWVFALIAGLAAAVIEQGAWRLFGYRLWHPFLLLPRAQIIAHASLLLASAPFVWPTLVAALLGMITALRGKRGDHGHKKKGRGRADVSCVLGGFRWDRNSFCRGWLCTGATGAGKTQSAVNPVMHQVFTREAGEEKETWEGSPLQAKGDQLQEAYLLESEPFIQRRRDIERELETLRQAREDLYQLATIELIDGDTQAEHNARNLNAAIEYLGAEIESAQDERGVRLAELNTTADGARSEWLHGEIERLNLTIDSLHAERSAKLSGEDPAALGPKQTLLRELDAELAAKGEAVDRIEAEELYPLRARLQNQLRQVESARYLSYPWGGLCVDEKGLYWQTLQEMARNYGREHHLMLLQTRPDWAPKGWKPPARFNLLSDDVIPANTYAKAIVDTATSVAGGEGDKGFFKTQAESNIGWAITLQREVKMGLIALGHDAKEIPFPSMGLCLQLLSSKTFFAKWVQENGLLPTSGNNETGKIVRMPAVIQSAKLTETIKHFEERYWSQPADQLGGVVGTIYNYLNYFTNDDVAEVFCADNTFDFRDIDLGMILCVAMPQKLQVERRYVCTLLKLLYYSHVLRRFDLGASHPRWLHRNLLICWQDEAQRFVTEQDGNVDVIREAHATTFLACQAKPSLYAPLGGKEKANVTILNLRNRCIFQAADDDCATGSADFLGKREKTKISRTSSSSGTSTSYSKEDVHQIKPHEFRALPKFTAIICHADGKFKRSIICPITPDGKLRLEWLSSGQRLSYKIQTWLGRGWKPVPPPRGTKKG